MTCCKTRLAVQTHLLGSMLTVCGQTCRLHEGRVCRIAIGPICYGMSRIHVPCWLYKWHVRQASMN